MSHEQSVPHIHSNENEGRSHEDATLARANKLIPPCVVSVIDLLESAGYETWLVGGFVRDLLLERPLHDFDLTTAAPWQQVKELCVAAGYAAHETGTKHGTITVVADDTALEITTFRTEGAYLDHRRPSEVIFTDSIEKDLARRDFTVNAMAFHPARGILDPFGGQTDLRERMIRCVGDANARFPKMRCASYARCVLHPS